MSIHPTAIIDPRAELGTNVFVGPYCVLGPGVELGDGCWLQHHVSMTGPVKIGKDNRFFHACSIGEVTQDLKYREEPTYAQIGHNNTFREYVTVHRATMPGDATRIGSDGNFLAYSHVAHDCVVGDRVIFSNNGTLAGHVEVGDHAVIGGLTAVHQFCRIGRLALTGGCSKIVQDVPPFMIADGNPAEVRTVNVVGMERAGMSEEQIRNVKRVYQVLYRKELNLKQAMSVLHAEHTSPEAVEIIAFIEKSQRGIVR